MKQRALLAATALLLACGRQTVPIVQVAPGFGGPGTILRVQVATAYQGAVVAKKVSVHDVVVPLVPVGPGQFLAPVPPLAVGDGPVALVPLGS